MQKLKDLQVIKRDGRIEYFNSNKITNAIVKAILKVNKTDLLDDIYTITADVVDIISYNYENKIDIKDIENIVESQLMDYDHDVAREYTSYRGARDASRMRSSSLVQKINGLLNYTDPDIIAENANKSADKIYVQRDLLAGTVAKEITKDLNLIPPRVQKARMENYIHWHDEDYSPLFKMYNCILIDYRTMLEKGFIVGNALIENPKSFGVACTLLSQIIQGVACSQYGGQTINRIDEGLAPYVIKSYKKIVFDLLDNYIILEDEDQILNEYNKEEIFKIIDSLNSIAEIKNYLYSLDFYKCGKIIDKSLKKIEKTVYDGIQCLEYQVNTLYTTNG